MKEYFYIFVYFIIFFILNSCQNKNENKKQNEVDLSKNSLEYNDIADTIHIALDYDTMLWTEVRNISIDLKYATTDNFVKEKLYNCARCFLRPEVYKKLLIINEQLSSKGFQLKLFDCYRPRPIQQKLWNIVPDARYVTPPKRGSMHNRGLAVDLTIIDNNGQELDMGTKFDFFGAKAYHTYTNLPEKVLNNRNLLKGLMTRYGFKAIRTEWWHYSYTKKTYPLSDWLWNCN